MDLWKKLPNFLCTAPHTDEQSLAQYSVLPLLLIPNGELTFELWVGDAAPLPTSIAYTSAAHHVTQNIMAFIPLISHTVHYPLTGSANLLMG